MQGLLGCFPGVCVVSFCCFFAADFAVQFKEEEFWDDDNQEEEEEDEKEQEGVEETYERKQLRRQQARQQERREKERRAWGNWPTVVVAADKTLSAQQRGTYVGLYVCVSLSLSPRTRTHTYEIHTHVTHTHLTSTEVITLDSFCSLLLFPQLLLRCPVPALLSPIALLVSCACHLGPRC